MDLTDVLLFIHIAAAMAWVGGGFVAAVMASRMKTAEPAHRLGFARMMRWASTGLFLPAALVVLAAGVWMVLDSDVYGFDQMWISIGLGVIAITVLMVPFFFKPTADRGIAAMESGDGPAAGAAMRRLGLGSRALLVLEFVVVWAMIVKPGL